MSIGPMIIEVGKPFAWEVDPERSGHVRQLTVYCPVRKRHFVISESTALRETLVFASDSEGNLDHLREEAGGKGMTVESVLEEWCDGTLYWLNCEDLS